jgi:hypothetical protein
MLLQSAGDFFSRLIYIFFKGEKSDLFHIGYFRDSPDEPPVFVASNAAAEGPKITPLAENIFGAVYQHLAKVKISTFIRGFIFAPVSLDF